MYFALVSNAGRPANRNKHPTSIVFTLAFGKKKKYFLFSSSVLYIRKEWKIYLAFVKLVHFKAIKIKRYPMKVDNFMAIVCILCYNKTAAYCF